MCQGGRGFALENLEDSIVTQTVPLVGQLYGWMWMPQTVRGAPILPPKVARIISIITWIHHDTYVS